MDAISSTSGSELKFLGKSQSAAVHHCAECDEELATHCCNNCYYFLCELHMAAHQKSKSTKTHSFTEANQVKNPPIKLSTQCKVHNAEFALFCESDRSLLCPVCALSLNVAVDKHKKEIISEI